MGARPGARRRRSRRGRPPPRPGRSRCSRARSAGSGRSPGRSRRSGGAAHRRSRSRTSIAVPEDAPVGGREERARAASRASSCPSRSRRPARPPRPRGCEATRRAAPRRRCAGTRSGRRPRRARRTARPSATASLVLSVVAAGARSRKRWRSSRKRLDSKSAVTPRKMYSIRVPSRRIASTAAPASASPIRSERTNDTSSANARGGDDDGRERPAEREHQPAAHVDAQVGQVVDVARVPAPAQDLRRARRRAAPSPPRAR